MVSKMSVINCAMRRHLMPKIGYLNFTLIGTMMTGEVIKVFKDAAVSYFIVVSREVPQETG
jgi:hypothetical protein